MIETIMRWKNRWTLSVTDVITTNNKLVADEWKNINGYITSINKYGVDIKIMKGNKHHRKNKKLWSFPIGLIKKVN